MKERLASCQGSFLRWSGEAGNGLIRRNGRRYPFVQRKSSSRRARNGMMGRPEGTVQCSLGNRGSLEGPFAISKMNTITVVSKNPGMGRVRGKMVAMKAVRNAKGQRIDPEDVQVQSSMGEGSFGQVFQVSRCDCWFTWLHYVVSIQNSSNDNV